MYILTINFVGKKKIISNFIKMLIYKAKQFMLTKKISEIIYIFYKTVQGVILNKYLSKFCFKYDKITLN